VALEFGRKFTETKQAIEEVIRIVDGLIKGEAKGFRERFIYMVDRTIPKTEKIPDDTENFKLVPGLNVYPILLHEKAYPDIHAMAATERKRIIL